MKEQESETKVDMSAGRVHLVDMWHTILSLEARAPLLLVIQTNPHNRPVYSASDAASFMGPAFSLDGH